ncbi:glycoside hydrolase family 3 N-terminal domain-containing protein [Streptomyces sp. NPDC102360]|uniref:beta-glucosidase n=1 Tax=Streptomyces sp. NPDC102360 TaxID=3366160 RepID=UPI0038015B7F
MTRAHTTPTLTCPDPAVEAELDTLLARMPLDEKTALVSNQQHTNGALPVIRAADGAAGIRLVPGVATATAATALPAPIALAATWDTSLAAEYGTVLGRELVATGHHVLLGPAVDIARVPLTGRIYESFGEDPYLTAQLVVPEIRALQAEGAQACVKHFLANNQEHARATVDAHVDERTLREIYLPPFEAAVRHAGAAAVMTSYNRLNGTYASEHDWLLDEVLRGQWKFDGWVMSDFLANHSLHASFAAGLDWELTDAPEWGDHLAAAIRAGEIAEQELDLHLRRILRPFLALQQQHPAVPLTEEEVRSHRTTGQEAAARSAVLLRNNGLLPLDAARCTKIAVIGPDATDITAAGAGSPLVSPHHATGHTSLVDALRTLLPGADIRHTPGTAPISAGVLLPGPGAIPPEVLSTPDTDEPGLRAEYWTNDTFTGAPAFARTEHLVEVNRGHFSQPGFHAPSPNWQSWPQNVPARHATRWTGHLTAPCSGTYELSVTHLGTARLFLDDALVIDVSHRDTLPEEREIPEGILWSGAGATVHTATVTLSAGQRLHIRLDYAADLPEQSDHYGAQIRLGWQPPADCTPPRHQEALDLARWADVTVVAARAYETEAFDRPTTRLPQGQDDLIRLLTRHCPDTVVITQSGGPTDSSSWREHVAAHLHAWYGGQDQGQALAELLIGAREPEGRLPLTFPGHPVTPDTYPDACYPGTDGRVRYEEQQAVGYRAQLRAGSHVFGHGLTYTTFTVHDVYADSEAHHPERPLTVTASVTNTGPREGSEVVQLYCRVEHQDSTHCGRLVAWQRVRLRAGQTRQIQLTIDPGGPNHPMWQWNPRRRRWEPTSRPLLIDVGSSAQQIYATLRLAPEHGAGS